MSSITFGDEPQKYKPLQTKANYISKQQKIACQKIHLACYFVTTCYLANWANTLWKTSTVFAICSSVCAVEINKPSN